MSGPSRNALRSSNALSVEARIGDEPRSSSELLDYRERQKLASRTVSPPIPLAVLEPTILQVGAMKKRPDVRTFCIAAID